MNLEVTLAGFSPTQRKIMEVLIDGKPHHYNELLLALDEDGYTTKNALKVQLTAIRVVLRKRGQMVFYHQGTYQWVRNLPSASDGKY